MKHIYLLATIGIISTGYAVNSIRLTGYEDSVVDVARDTGVLKEALEERKRWRIMTIPGTEFCSDINWSRHSEFLGIQSTLDMRGEYLDGTSIWNQPDSMEPPLLIHDAISTALEWANEKVHEASWQFDSLTLDTVLEGEDRYFVYVVTVKSPDLHEEISIGVLPNRIVIEPISWEEVMRRHNQDRLNNDKVLQEQMARRMHLAERFPTRIMDTDLNDFLESGINFQGLTTALGSPDLQLPGQAKILLYKLDNDWILVVTTVDMLEIQSIDIINKKLSFSDRIYDNNSEQVAGGDATR